jgi:hypothetical protein
MDMGRVVADKAFANKVGCRKAVALTLAPILALASSRTPVFTAQSHMPRLAQMYQAAQFVLGKLPAVFDAMPLAVSGDELLRSGLEDDLPTRWLLAELHSLHHTLRDLYGCVPAANGVCFLHGYTSTMTLPCHSRPLGSFTFLRHMRQWQSFYARWSAMFTSNMFVNEKTLEAMACSTTKHSPPFL